VNDVPMQDAVALLVKAHRGSAPTEADIHRIAESMNVSPSVAADRLRAMNTGIEGQFGALARGLGVADPDASDRAGRARLSRLSVIMCLAVISAHGSRS
jgi:hypothetical protein